DGAASVPVAEPDSIRTARLSAELPILLCDGGSQQSLDAGPAAGPAAAGFQAGGRPVSRALSKSLRRGSGVSATDASREEFARPVVHGESGHRSGTPSGQKHGCDLEFSVATPPRGGSRWYYV